MGLSGNFKSSAVNKELSRKREEGGKGGVKNLTLRLINERRQRCLSSLFLPSSFSALTCSSPLFRIRTNSRGSRHVERRKSTSIPFMFAATCRSFPRCPFFSSIQYGETSSVVPLIIYRASEANA